MPGGSEPLPWPAGDESGSPAGEGGLEGLDAELDEALGDFDEAMGEGGSGEDEIDILNPMSSGSSGAADNQPVFEESGGGGEGGAEGDSGENSSVAQRAAEGASGGEGGSEGGSESGQQSGASSAGGAAGSAAAGQEGNSNAGQADGGDADIIPIPDDVGDGRDDDVVLRQIREAAMNEKDPVLREKLWDEYRRIRDQR